VLRWETANVADQESHRVMFLDRMLDFSIAVVTVGDIFHYLGGFFRELETTLFRYAVSSSLFRRTTPWQRNFARVGFKRSRTNLRPCPGDVTGQIGPKAFPALSGWSRDRCSRRPDFQEMTARRTLT
jgi:hypothetical protein